MLNYPCLVLDHDDTVVQSEEAINYPFFCQVLRQIRPGQSLTLGEYTAGCFYSGFAAMCRDRFRFTLEELEAEYRSWQAYVRTHIPPPYPGIDRVIRRQKEEGGLICVVSHSSDENIIRDYRTHFGVLPDEIYSWDLPEERRKPSPYSLERIMEKHGFAPEQLLVVDDMKPGYDMAAAVSVPAAYAGWSRKDCPDISREMEHLCSFSFHSPGELYDFLFSPRQ